MNENRIVSWAGPVLKETGDALIKQTTDSIVRQRSLNPYIITFWVVVETVEQAQFLERGLKDEYSVRYFKSEGVYFYTEKIANTWSVRISTK